MSQHRDDRRDIEAVLLRYVSAIDGKQYDLLGEVFVPEGVADYVGLAECKGLDNIKQLVSSVLDRCGATQHLLGNVQIDVQGDAATASCYLQALHVGLGAHAGKTFTVWGIYRDRLVRTTAGWRIRHRELTTLHAEGDIGLGETGDAGSPRQ